jgi:hypothetical protein
LGGNKKKNKDYMALHIIKRPHHEGVCGSGGLALRNLKLEARSTINFLAVFFLGIRNWCKLDDLAQQLVK